MAPWGKWPALGQLVGLVAATMNTFASVVPAQQSLANPAIPQGPTAEWGRPVHTCRREVPGP